MGRILWLAFGALAVLTVVSAEAVVKCLDEKGNNCQNFRVIAQNADEVSDVLRKYRYVASVDLHGNLMEEFEARDTRSVNQWKFLNLSYNLLEEIQLRGSQADTIDLTYNKLTRFDVPALVKDFRAERNQLWRITFAGRRVENLVLSKNKLEKLDMIQNLLNLKHLDLSCNRISEVNFDDLVRMRQLTHLNLAHNRIYITSGNNRLGALQSIDLSNNILTVIDASFQAVSNVNELYIQNNRIVMVVDKDKGLEFRNLRTLDARGNDWHCPSVTDLPIQSAPEYTCEEGYYLKSGLCCSQTMAPFADRLIRYRKQEHYALRNSSAQRAGQEVDCSKFKPSPCDGDDNKVYEVAGLAATDAASLARASLDDLKGQAQQLKHVVEQKKHQLAAEQAKNAKAESTLQTLKDKIFDEYRKENLTGHEDNPLQQLEQLFGKLNRDNDETAAGVDEKKREIQNALDDISKIQEELDDVKEKTQRLVEDINKRNGTVLDLQKQIADLTKQIEAKKWG